MTRNFFYADLTLNLDTILIIVRRAGSDGICPSTPCHLSKGQDNNQDTQSLLFNKIYSPGLALNGTKAYRSYFETQKRKCGVQCSSNKGMKQALIHLDCAF
jgi:hypothetical protein